MGAIIKIIKILNNNAVVVADEEREKVAIGAGIAFNKRRNDIVNHEKIEKIFVMRENDKLEQLLNRIPVEHFTICEEIITYAEEYLRIKLAEHIHIVLTDHISFAIERTKEGIQIHNKLLQEIRVLYQNEFAVGLWALQHIKERCQVEMPVDEAAFIALHLHTMKPHGGELRETLRYTTIIRDIVQLVKEKLHISIEEEGIAYQRLITHLRFMLARFNEFEHHTMDEEMSEMIRKKFPQSYHCAEEIADYLQSTYTIELPLQELGYIAIHIERLRR